MIVWILCKKMGKYWQPMEFGLHCGVNAERQCKGQASALNRMSFYKYKAFQFIPAAEVKIL